MKFVSGSLLWLLLLTIGVSLAISLCCQVISHNPVLQIGLPAGVLALAQIGDWLAWRYDVLRVGTTGSLLVVALFLCVIWRCLIRRSPTAPRKVSLRPIVSSVLSVLTWCLYQRDLSSSILRTHSYFPCHDIAWFAGVSDSLIRNIPKFGGASFTSVLATRDAFGSYSYLALIASGVRLPTWIVTQFAMLSILIILSVVVSKFFEVFFGSQGRVFQVIATVAIVASPLSLYQMSQYFLSQQIATLFLISTTLVCFTLARSSPTSVSVSKSAILMLLYVSGLLLTYPPMVVLALAIWISVFGLFHLASRKSLPNAGVHHCTSILWLFVPLAGVIVIPGRIGPAMARSKFLASWTGGETLGPLTLGRSLGIGHWDLLDQKMVRFSDHVIDIAIVTISIVILIGFLRIARSQIAIPLAVGGGVLVTVLLYVLLQSPGAYRSWKLVGSTTPIITICFIVSLFELLARNGRFRSLFVILLSIPLVATLSTSSVGQHRQAMILTSDLEKLEEQTARLNDSTVFIDLVSPWEITWASLLVGQHRNVIERLHVFEGSDSVIVNSVATGFRKLVNCSHLPGEIKLNASYCLTTQ